MNEKIFKDFHKKRLNKRIKNGKVNKSGKDKLKTNWQNYT